MKKLKITIPEGYIIQGFDLKTGEVLVEVKPADWIVTSFRSTSDKERLYNFNGEFYTWNSYRFTFESMVSVGYCVNTGHYEVYSVKRSDGIKFKIGDNTNTGIISKFEMQDNMIRVWFEGNPSKYHMNLISLRHVLPLFKTEDGIDIYSGDTYWLINYKNWTIPGTWTNIAGDKTQLNTYHKAFISEKNANEYIIMNKPILSINDVLDSLTGLNWEKKSVMNALKAIYIEKTI